MEIRAERLRSAFQQIPVAALVTVVNAALVAGVVSGSQHDRWISAWFTATVLVAIGRLVLWAASRRLVRLAAPLWPWSLASAGGAFLSGLLWGGGSVWLLPGSDVSQLFWVFLIGGMCAGAASLHYAHLPTALAFIVPSALPLAVRYAWEGTGWHAAAAIMIVVFLMALIVTSGRSSRYFSEMLRLRFDLLDRTHELAAINEKLRKKMEEHQATEAILRHAHKMEAVGQLTGGIAHDFNNLLTVVLGNLSLLRKYLPEDDARATDLLESAVRGAERGASLTQRLLAFGRRQVLRPEVLDLPSLVQGALGLVQSSVGTGVRISLRFPDRLSPVVVDANQLELALLNLAVNARDAMGDDGEIVISAYEEPVSHREAGGPASGDYVVLSITDNGEGMDEVTLGRATEPFFTTKEPGKGTGLGLSMVHGLVAQSGGQLRLHSRPGEGTVVELWLPRAVLATDAEAPPPGWRNASDPDCRDPLPG
jgi:signal transduction histidine kinase